MTGSVLRQARKRAGLTQMDAAVRFGLSQPLFAAMETGRRSVTAALAERVVVEFGLSPVHLPFTVLRATDDQLAGNLAALEYPGFSHLTGTLRNPAEVLFDALNRENLDARLVEGLPWLPLKYPDMDWEWLYKLVKLHNQQNRLGFVVVWAAKSALAMGQSSLAIDLYHAMRPLYEARLAKCDTLCQASWPPSMRQYAHRARTRLAAFWNLDTRLKETDLAYLSA